MKSKLVKLLMGHILKAFRAKKIGPGWQGGLETNFGGTLELKSGKTHISAPAHPSATGIGRVSGLVESKSWSCFKRDTQFLFSILIGQFVKKLLFHWKKERLDARGAMA